jgi:hypothetical protein
LFDIFQALALQLSQPDVVLSFIDARLPHLTGQYDRYRKESFVMRKIEILTAIGKTQEAENMVWENLDIVAVRQGEVDKALAKKDFTSAKALIAEGLRVAQTLDHPGTVASWQEKLLYLAVLENDTETIRHYARHFAFNQGFSQKHYQQWKATYSRQEWPAVIEAYIAETIKHTTNLWNTQKGQYWQPPHPPLLQKLGPVYIQERYWDRLLALVQQENNLETILDYHQYLAPHYPMELLNLYLPAFEHYGQQASGRDQYADLVDKMKKVMKAIPAGKEQILALARELKAKYARRPAMVGELNKLLQ